MILLLKASLVVIFLLAFYKLFLERESFFRANRIFLLACLVLACALPFITLPKMIQHQGYVDNLYETLKNKPTIESSNDKNNEGQLELFEDNQSEDIKHVKKAVNQPTENEMVKSMSSDVELKNQDQNIPVIENKESTSKGWPFWIISFYLFGVIVLIFNLIGQIINVTLKVIRNPDQIEDEGVVIVNMKGEVEPCSFFKYIFINPSNYDFETYEQIIAHEKVHVQKGHTIDLLLSEIAVIILWFNPFVWVLRKEVEKNIEYQTDEALIAQESDIKEIYQLNLVKIACNTSPLAITTNYNQSLIKQRILRMNAKRSNQFSYWKYVFSLPLAFILLLALNRPYHSTAQSSSLLDEPIDSRLDDSIQDNSDTISSIDLPKASPIGDSKDKIAKIEKVDNSKSDFSKKIFDSKWMADCEEFEKAVANGDLVRVKEILKTLDPDCLKIKKNERSNLNAVENLVKNSKSDLKSKVEKRPEEREVCQRLRIAVNDRDNYIIRDILQNENIACLADIYGGPTKDIELIKGLMSYGAAIYVYNENVIRIDNIDFRIGIDDSEVSDCTDSNYLKLVSAIKVNNEDEIRRILSEETLTCPLNINGVRNDFIFIKQLMKYNPIIRNHNNRAITVGGVGIEIDMDRDKHSKNYTAVLNDIENSLKASKEDDGELSCLTLIDAIQVQDYKLTKEILRELGVDCFHRETTTISDGEDKLVVSKVTTPLLAAIRLENESLTKLLLENDAGVNYSGDGKETPLIAAAKSGDLEIVKLLVNRGADLNRRDEATFTALKYSRFKYFENIEKYLVSKGAR